MKARLSERPTFRQRHPREGGGVNEGKGLKVQRSITIGLPPTEIYQFWRQLENLPRFMYHVKSVKKKSEGISHWVVETAKGLELEWDAQIIEDKPDEMISWRSLEGAEVHNAGSVWFKAASGNRGTVVKVAIRYSPPAGKVGAAFAKLAGDSAERQIANDLFRLKSLLETHESPQTEGQPNGGQRI
jgi:uncharacterized membrane protein